MLVEGEIDEQRPGPGKDLDRIAHHATVITTKGRSYRMRKRASDERSVDPRTPGLSKPAKKS